MVNTSILLAGMHLWRSDYGPLTFKAQLDFCRRLIVVPLSTFHRLAELIGDPKGELIFLSHTSRCGSTLLAQVVHRITDNLGIYNDPHDLKSLSSYAMGLCPEFRNYFPLQPPKLCRTCTIPITPPDCNFKFLGFFGIFYLCKLFYS